MKSAATREKKNSLTSAREKKKDPVGLLECDVTHLAKIFLSGVTYLFGQTSAG